MERHRLVLPALAVLAALVLTGEGFLAVAFGDFISGAQPIVNRLAAGVHSFHVDIPADASGGPVGADVSGLSASRVYPISGLRAIDDGPTTYLNTGKDGRWLVNRGMGDWRVSEAATWIAGAVFFSLVGREQLPDGPALHLRNVDLPLWWAGGDRIDIWVGPDGLPRRAIRLTDRFADGHERTYRVEYTYSMINRVPPVLPPDPVLMVQPGLDVTGHCARRSGTCLQNGDTNASLTVGGAKLVVTRIGMAAEQPLPPQPPTSGRHRFVLDLRLISTSSIDVSYELTLIDGVEGAVPLAPGGEIGMHAAGSLAPGQTSSGRLVYDWSGAGTPPGLEVRVGGRYAYVWMDWEMPRVD